MDFVVAVVAILYFGAQQPEVHLVPFHGTLEQCQAATPDMDAALMKMEVKVRAVDVKCVPVSLRDGI